MSLPEWFKDVCPQPSWWRYWRQPAELQAGRDRYAMQTSTFALFAWRLGPEDKGPPVPEDVALGVAGWLRQSAPLRVSSRALLEFLAAACECPAKEDAFGNEAPIGIGGDVFDARLLLANLSEIEDWPEEVFIGWASQAVEHERKCEAVLIVAPRWRYIAMPLRPHDSPCWRLEDCVRVRR